MAAQPEHDLAEETAEVEVAHAALLMANDQNELVEDDARVTVNVVEAINNLVARQEKWLMAQPEWPLVFLADRQTRRKTARLLAHRFTTIPQRRGTGA